MNEDEGGEISQDHLYNFNTLYFTGCHEVLITPSKGVRDLGYFGIFFPKSVRYILKVIYPSGYIISAISTYLTPFNVLFEHPARQGE